MTRESVSGTLRSGHALVARPQSPSVLAIPWPVASQQSRRLFHQRSGSPWLGAHRLLVAGDDGLWRFAVLIMAPVGLEQHRIDLLEIDGFGAIADGFDQCSDTEVAHGAQGSLGAACDEVESLLGEGAVGQADEIELSCDEGGDVIRGESLDLGRVGDAGPDVLVDSELHGGVEAGLCDEDEVVVLGEVLKQEAQFT